MRVLQNLLRTALLAVALLACLLGGAPALASDDYAAFCEGKVFADQLPDEELPKPDRVISCFDDFVYALDYLAFYRIGDAVYFEFSPEYAESFYNPYSEFQKAYLRSDLADVYACHLEDGDYSRYGVAAVKYSMSRDIASVPAQDRIEAPVVAPFDYDPQGDADLVFAIEEAGLPQVPCENGEQLYYLAMNGYCPVPQQGSMAQVLYEQAKDVLRGCVRQDMTDFEKIRAVYDWLTTQVVYDAATAYSSDTYLVKEQAYYLEGVFLNRCAVCDGKAKACALLLNMLGIPCYRETGVSEGGDHAWNVVRLDGRWYTLCSTYGQKDMTDALGRIVANYSMFLAGRDTPREEDWGYKPQKHPEIDEVLERDAYDIYGAMGDLAEVDLKVGDVGELEDLLETVAQRAASDEYTLEFAYDGDDKELFEAQMVACLEALTNANVVEIRRAQGTAYQVIDLE